MSGSSLRPPGLRALALPIALAGFVGASAGRPAAADTVYLTNGEVFEGVIAQVGAKAVEIRLPYGEIRLPSSRVARVERSSSTFEEYLRRKEALGGGASARRWLDLALWARTADFTDGVREAALRAAALDPRLDGLAPVMTSLGYVLDEDTGRWLSEDELLRRRGYVRVAGQWVSPEALEAQSQAAEAERRRQLEARRADREDTLTQAITLLAASEVARSQADQAGRTGGGGLPLYPAGPFGSSAVYPVAVFPGIFGAPQRGRGRPPAGGGAHSAGPGPSAPPAGRAPAAHHSGYDSLAVRQPGSIIPLDQFSTSAQTHRGHNP